MDEGFSAHTDIKWAGHTGTVEYGGGDRGMICMFYNKSMHNPAKSQETGRPFYEDQVFVRIHPPGERLNIVDRPLKDTDKQRWPVQWAQFQQNKQQVPEGTPIDVLYPEHPSVAAVLRAAAVHTIEQCADLSGPAIDNIGMGAQRYVNDSKKYLEAATKGVGTSRMRHEMDELKRENKVLTQTIEQLKEQIHALAQNGQNAALSNMQTMLAQAMGRPVNLPGTGFDPQAAMIDSTSPTKLATVAKTSRRPRARLAG